MSQLALYLGPEVVSQCVEREEKEEKSNFNISSVVSVFCN